MSGALSRLRVKAIGFPKPGSGRDTGIDALKGFAIILVVLGHCFEIADPGLFVPNASFRHHLATFIYTFHMPLFIFLAGYVMSGKTVRVGRSFLRLMVPFFTWMLLKFFLTTPIGSYGRIARYSGDTVWGMANAPLWFLWTLFFCYLLLIAVQYGGRFWKYGEELGFFVIWLAVNFIPSTRLGIPQVQYYFAFFALGYLGAKYKDRISDLKPAVKITILAASPVVLLVVYFSTYYSLRFVMVPMALSEILKNPGIFFARYAMGMLGILSAFALLAAVKAVKARRVEAAFAWLGLATLDIYVTHGLLIQLSFGTGWVKVGSAFLIAMIGGLTLTYLLLRNWRFLSYPCLGKSYKYGPRYRLEFLPQPGASAAGGVVDLTDAPDRFAGDD
ncbi:MAG: acyltransferase family protein [Candidatus Geothermincolia bacterium]